MKKIIIIVLLIIAAAAAVYGAVFYRKNLRGVGPALSKPSGDITTMLPPAPSAAVNQTGLPLKLPDGFSISIFAKNLPGARVIAFDGFGNMWVSQTSQGTISQVEIKDGVLVRQSVVFKNLKRPHGLAIDGNVLYYAEENKITRVTLYSDDPGQKIADLPGGGRHYTRTLGFGPDGRLYVSIGSSCDTCNEGDERRAAVYSMNKDGSDFRKEASGLRNTVFFVWDKNGKMWGTDMGRDYLGDNLPPDEINIIERGKDYGWPICYGQNVHDTTFDKNQYIQNPCNGKVSPKVELPAHSAPLGLAFVPDAWPKEYQNNLFVAFHGSWNRSQPTGYKIARVKFDNGGNYTGMEDFVAGWLAEDGKTALGRPVDVVFYNDIMYVSDDKAGVIYRVAYGK